MLTRTPIYRRYRHNNTTSRLAFSGFSFRFLLHYYIFRTLIDELSAQLLFPNLIIFHAAKIHNFFISSIYAVVWWGKIMFKGHSKESLTTNNFMLGGHSLGVVHPMGQLSGLVISQPRLRASHS